MGHPNPTQGMATGIIYIYTFTVQMSTRGAMMER